MLHSKKQQELKRNENKDSGYNTNTAVCYLFNSFLKAKLSILVKSSVN